MPLMPCPACGREVSPAAVTCPQCGHPMAVPVSTRGRAFDVDPARLAKALGQSERPQFDTLARPSWGAIVLNTLAVIFLLLTIGAELSNRSAVLSGYILVLIFATWARIAQAAAHHRTMLQALKRL